MVSRLARVIHGSRNLEGERILKLLLSRPVFSTHSLVFFWTYQADRQSFLNIGKASDNSNIFTQSILNKTHSHYSRISHQISIQHSTYHNGSHRPTAAPGPSAHDHRWLQHQWRGDRFQTGQIWNYKVQLLPQQRGHQYSPGQAPQQTMLYRPNTGALPRLRTRPARSARPGGAERRGRGPRPVLHQGRRDGELLHRALRLLLPLGEEHLRRRD